MTAKEFVAKNQDILLRRMTEEDYQKLTDGAVLFCITVYRSNKPLEERTVCSANYEMVVATNADCIDNPDTVLNVSALALTQSGYAKMDYILPTDIKEGEGTKLLYECKPLPPNDPRRNHHWVIR